MHFQRITAFNWCEVSVLQQQGNNPERVSQITSLQVVFNQVIITTDDYKDIYIWKLQVVGHRLSVLTMRQLSAFQSLFFEVQFSESIRILWDRDLNLILCKFFTPKELAYILILKIRMKRVFDILQILKKWKWRDFKHTRIYDMLQIYWIIQNEGSSSTRETCLRTLTGHIGPVHRLVTSCPTRYQRNIEQQCASPSRWACGGDEVAADQMSYHVDIHPRL